MPFSTTFSASLVDDALARAEHCTNADVQAAIASGAQDARAVAVLLSPAAGRILEQLAEAAHATTLDRFGKTMGLFAPLYLSNDCVCTCSYCGFSMGLDIKRKTLRIDEVIREARALERRGLRNILLVSSEHPKLVPADYLAQCVAEVKRLVPYVALEVAAAETSDYTAFVGAGCDGIVLYQETYDTTAYARYHLGGPKKRFSWRMDALERAGQAGIRHLGAGALLGLADWRFEGIALIEHVRFLQRRAWRSQVNVSVPRINPAAGEFAPTHPVSDAQLVQLVCALRIALPTAGIVLSTREPSTLRDHLVPLGITQMSAGSSTEPGGYNQPHTAGEQFHLEDTRTPQQVVQRLRELGYDPVFKDWERMASGVDERDAVEVKAAGA